MIGLLTALTILGNNPDCQRFESPEYFDMPYGGEVCTYSRGLSKIYIEPYEVCGETSGQVFFSYKIDEMEWFDQEEEDITVLRFSSSETESFLTLECFDSNGCWCEPYVLGEDW